MAGKQKILIVDDDSNIAELISLYLTKELYETVIAEDGEMALALFEREHPDLILLDLMLPGIDGMAVCREIRKKSQIPIIMLSAKGETFDKVLGLEMGADDYMIKPFDPKELVARVKAVLRRSQGQAPAAPAKKTGRGPHRGLPGSHHQPDQLFRSLPGKDRRHAPERTGAPLFPRVASQPGLHA